MDYSEYMDWCYKRLLKKEESKESFGLHLEYGVPSIRVEFDLDPEKISKLNIDANENM